LRKWGRASCAWRWFVSPVGLSAYFRLVWNLDALVQDRYGRPCVQMRAQRFAIHRCASPRFNDGDSRACRARFELAVTPADIDGSGPPAVEPGDYQVRVGNDTANFSITG
jgi:hypothetical protein